MPTAFSLQSFYFFSLMFLVCGAHRIWLLALCSHQIHCMDLICDEVKYSFCKVNIDGGNDLNVALISEENNFTNSSEETYEINFTIVPVDQYGGIIEQLNVAYDSENETWTDEWPRDFYENPENIQKIQLEFQNLTKIKVKQIGETDHINSKS